MVPLLQRLVDLLNALQLGPRTFPDALRNLLRAVAAQGIQDSPADATPLAGDWPGEALEALEHGAAEAARLNAAGLTLHIEVEPLPLGLAAGHSTDRPLRSYGPFVDREGRLLRFIAFESPALVAVVVRTFVAPDETVLLIPSESAAEAGNDRNWTLPAGSVWIKSRFLVAGAPEFAGLRITGGTLTFTGAITREPTRIIAMDASPWTLSVEPETGDATADGSDAAALTIAGPSRLTVNAAAPPEVSGEIAVSGFGTDLHASATGAAPFISDRLCRFPLAATEAAWTIGGNRSDTAQFAGTATVGNAEWALPVSPLGPGAITAAPHGGSLLLTLTGDLKSRSAGIAGAPFTWFVSTLTLNAGRVVLSGLQVTPGGRADIGVWPDASSSFLFAQAPLRGLRFRSERGGEDAVAIQGGRQRNLWDVPRRADDVPFPFEGDIETFGLVRYAEGHLLTSLATTEPPAGSGGLAFENLYLVVRAPRRCALVAAFEPASLDTPAGIAYLFHDARCAVPMLPDPYAANTTLIDRGDTFQPSLYLELQWIWSQRPAVVAHLDGDIRFTLPQPPAPENDDEHDVSNLFRGYLDAALEQVLLLDVSSAEHLFGVAFESPNAARPAIDHNRLAMPLNRVRLFMQPQVHWEPVWIQPNPHVRTLHEGFVRSQSNGGLTLLAARGDRLVPALPEPVSHEILQAIRDKRRAAALFSLPFGLRAMARLSPDDRNDGQVMPSAVDTEVHEPDFGELRSARQFRLTARNTRSGINDPERRMPGRLKQLKNLVWPNASSLESVLPHDEQEALNLSFTDSIPLHHADLSGYGLSAFSEWRRQGDVGVTKVHFEVMNGRTAYEVVEFRSALFECGARVVRTVTIERRNSAAVVLTDTGWVPIEDGLFDKPVGFEKGAIKALRNIRRIRITGPSFDIGLAAAVEPVVFDADAEIEGLESGGLTRTVPVLDRPGYVQVRPSQIGAPLLTPPQLQALFAKVGPITSPVDCRIRLADALGLEVSSLTSDFAPDDGNGIGFAVAAVGNPELPRAGQWSVVRIDPTTSEAFPIDPHRGVPVVRNGAAPFVLREPADARRGQPKVRYGLLMSTPSSRALFPQPRIDPASPRQIAADAPLVADPYSLVQAGTAFPRAAYALHMIEVPRFAITGSEWRLEPQEFTFNVPAGDLLKGGEWAMTRGYAAGAANKLRLAIDSAAAMPWAVQVPPSTLDLDLPLLPELQKILKIHTHYIAESGGLPSLAKPTLEFIGALKEVKDIVDTLSKLADLGFNVEVNVTSAGSASNPTFIVQLRLIFRLGKPSERVDIGVGKFFGQFLIDGNLEVGTSGVSKPRLFLEFQGDIQQGILPPLLYAGGLFRFGIEIPASGPPVIQLAMGVVASIGGDLIPGLLEVEVTVHYGYTLIPQTLEPGVLLGLDARAKLLGGLVGFSFGVEAMARIRRVDANGVRIWARIRVAASVQIAFLIEEDVDFETQFEQTLPLELAALLPGGQLVGLAAAVARA